MLSFWGVQSRNILRLNTHWDYHPHLYPRGGPYSSPLPLPPPSSDTTSKRHHTKCVSLVLLGSCQSIVRPVPRSPPFYPVVPSLTKMQLWNLRSGRISWYLAVVINILPHIVTWFVSVAWGTITESFKTRLGLYEAFKGWIKPIFYAARFAALLSQRPFVMRKKLISVRKCLGILGHYLCQYLRSSQYGEGSY